MMVTLTLLLLLLILLGLLLFYLFDISLTDNARTTTLPPERPYDYEEDESGSGG